MRAMTLTFRRWFLDGQLDGDHGRDERVQVLAPSDDADTFEADVLRQFVAAEILPHLSDREWDLGAHLKACLYYAGGGLFRFDPTGGCGPAPTAGRVLRVGLMACYAEEGFDLTRPEYAFDLLWVKGGVACDDNPRALAVELERAWRSQAAGA